MPAGLRPSDSAEEKRTDSAIAEELRARTRLDQPKAIAAFSIQRQVHSYPSGCLLPRPRTAVEPHLLLVPDHRREIVKVAGTELAQPQTGSLDDGCHARTLHAGALPLRGHSGTLEDVPRFAGAFATNARGIAAVTRIDDTDLPLDAARLAAIRQAYDSVPWDPI